MIGVLWANITVYEIKSPIIINFLHYYEWDPIFEQSFLAEKMVNKQFDLWVNCCYFVKVFFDEKKLRKKSYKY